MLVYEFNISSNFILEDLMISLLYIQLHILFIDVQLNLFLVLLIQIFINV